MIFTEFSEFIDNFFLKKASLEPTISCLRDRGDTTETQVKEMIFKLTLIHASVICTIC